MNAILTERVLAIAQAAEKAGHGGKCHRSCKTDPLTII
ncbi:hypothetical protein ArsFIN_34200 [Arsenophonus nasoniae]|uniref:Uncharacterized protein n=1 Tax=Arsenophonus nasoniae TaxID=638 RepID=A0A4V1BX87_9GAMM|nr:hypothetical protein ArsFIN_34200 [Arsenophonus nasoniae]